MDSQRLSFLERFKFGALRECKPNTKKLESSLADWLMYIFPNDTIIFDCAIPVNIWELRSNCRIEYKKYRPDARIESRNLIVEFDGIHHYNSAQMIFNDRERDAMLRQMGYKVIRIPFFVQLTRDVIKHYFDIEVDKGSLVTSGFFSDTRDPNHLNPFCPANFCPAGINRFYSELRSLPRSTVKEIFDSLALQCQHNRRDLVVPEKLECDVDSFYKMYQLLRSDE